MNEFKILISGDYNVFGEGWNGAGVYMASGNYKSGTFKLPIYIGSSINLQGRVEGDHIMELNRNVHFNPMFQYSWNKHNEKEGFVWYLLESCDQDITLEREQYYLDLYRPFVDEFGGFNVSKDSIASFKGRNHTEETRRKISESLIGNIPWNIGVETPQETRKKQSESRKKWLLQNINPTKGTKLSKKRVSQIIEHNSKEFKIIDPFGNVIIGKNIGKFCRDNNLTHKIFVDVLNNKRDCYKGYRNFKEELIGIEYKENKYIFIDPKGDIRSCDSISDFCLENNLKSIEMMSLVWISKKKSYKGWRKFKEELIGIPFNFKAIKKFICPNGNVVEVDNLSMLCKKYNLSSTCMSFVHSEKQDAHKGWSKYKN